MRSSSAIDTPPQAGIRVSLPFPVYSRLIENGTVVKSKVRLRLQRGVDTGKQLPPWFDVHRAALRV